MEYDLARDAQPDPYLDRSYARSGVPESMIMAKFEETDIGDEEQDYNNFARAEICDWSSDTNKFEHEESRGGVNARSGRLQAQYYGHRGEAEYQYRPEIFDGFFGTADRDPRGTQTEPDMKLMRDQHNARMRFQKFTSDADNATTGGNRSPDQILRDQQAVFHAVQSRLKVFSKQKLGRDNPHTVTYKNRSLIGKHDTETQCIGDKLDTTITPQRKATIIAKEVLRNTKAWRDETADADFACAKYTSVRKAAKQKRSNLVADSIDGFDGVRAAAEDQTTCFKSAAILMSDLVSRKQKIMSSATGDSDFAIAKQTCSRKLAPLVKDLTAIMQNSSTDAQFATSDGSMAFKTSEQRGTNEANHMSIANHSTPSHHLINAEIIFKTAARNGDLRKVADLVISDGSVVAAEDINRSGKTAKKRMLNGMKLSNAEEADRAESCATMSYKDKKFVNGDRRIRITAYGQNFTASDDTQNRLTQHKKHRIEHQDDTVQEQRYYDNYYQERHGRAMGSKYMVGYIDRDMKMGDMALLS